MKSVSASEAEKTFDELLNQVEQGETFEITRDGKTVAWLEPLNHESRLTVGEAVREKQEQRRTLPKEGMTIEDILAARDEGRK
jgi:antitoxin (DNA-binding transcriptional repressor) of toxin-antitoxin stability system